MQRRLTLALMALVACGGSDDLGGTANALEITTSGEVVVTLAAIEGGSPLAIGVRLQSPPERDLIVQLSSDPLVRLDRSSLTFTSVNFETSQPVVITAVDDVDVIDGAGVITLSGTDLTTLAVPIAVADDDAVALVGLPGDLLVMEGASATFAVALAADPGGPITITTAASAAGATVSPATLTFAADWAVAQTMTVTAPADADALDETVSIDLGGPHVVAGTVPVVVLDDERQNFVIAPTALALQERGPVGTFTVRLTQPPTGSLAIDVAVADPAIATATPATLTFTAADYQLAQTITVTPRADIDGAADASTVRLTSTGLRERAVALQVTEDTVVDVPAIAGDFLMTIHPGFGTDDVVRYRVTYAVDPITARLTFAGLALRVDNGEPIGDAIVAGGVSLAEDTQFQADFDGLLPAEANPFSGTVSMVDAVKLGRIVDANLLCGTMTGAVSSIPLDGTTWGAVRVTGSTLPTPIDACP